MEERSRTADPPVCQHHLPFTSLPDTSMPFPPSAPPLLSALLEPSDADISECWVASVDGDAYCTTNVASNCIKLLGVVFFFPPL